MPYEETPQSLPAEPPRPPAPEKLLMPTSLIDSAVFRDIFTTEAMRRVFSDENRVQKYLDFDAALAGLRSISSPPVGEGRVEGREVAQWS